MSKNGALTYALKHNKLHVVDLILMGEHQAKQLAWVGSVVWSDAIELLRSYK